ncbi:histidine kinase 5 [Phtheirospermum japonicum]|uniref:Histidine kinase 5 n=1 Tax=Phtheirospermum japonicum TaxID=374723 RepID=A0A830C9H9_9LAMI|nr:histidine kinase 5 [Phtheirospermum japonicum]
MNCKAVDANAVERRMEQSYGVDSEKVNSIERRGVAPSSPILMKLEMDKELRYLFIFNHFLSLGEQDIIDKTDVKIFSGAGVKEPQDFKREPIFSKTGETIGVTYMGMEVTDQVRNREKMAKLREEMVVQKAKETELNKTIHITGIDASDTNAGDDVSRDTVSSIQSREHGRDSFDH